MNFARRDPVGARTGGCEPGFTRTVRHTASNAENALWIFPLEGFQSSRLFPGDGGRSFVDFCYTVNAVAHYKAWYLTCLKGVNSARNV